MCHVDDANTPYQCPISGVRRNNQVIALNHKPGLREIGVHRPDAQQVNAIALVADCRLRAIR